MIGTRSRFLSRCLSVMTIGLVMIVPSAASAATAAELPVPEGLDRALQAIDRGDGPGFRDALDTLPADPLGEQARIYLEAKWLVDQVSDRPGRVVGLLRDHPDAPLMPRLKRRYLDYLAEEEDWGEYRLTFDRAPDIRAGTRHQCAYWSAELALDETLEESAIDEALAAWQRGRSQPEACDPVFDWLEDNGHLDENAYRTRIRNAVKAGQDGLARYLVRRGPAGLASYRDRWIALRDDPESAVSSIIEAGGGDAGELTQGLLWLAKRDPARARELLARAERGELLSAEQAGSVSRLAALKAGYLYEPQAYEWLREVPAEARDEEVWTWTVRSALRHLDWARVKEAIDAMPEELAEDREWRYWRAVADSHLGQEVAARPVWRDLARTPDYHGFLAADRLGLEYPLPERNGATLPEPEDEALARLTSRPGMMLAFALHQLDRPEDARRLFEHDYRSVPEELLPSLTWLAHRVDWHDRVAVLIARMDRQHDPEWYAARFALPHRELVEAQADEQSIDPDWIYAIMRRESLFMRDIGSGAGAQGLMQLMPDTARWVNRKAGLHLSPLALDDPETNIALGSAYLGHMAERFDGRYPLAIAAYNAGPGRIGDWLPEVPLPGDVWVDTILFDETRAYARAVLAGMVTYQWRREGRADRLGLLLPVIGPSD